jgi:hypothetical protein
MASEKSELPTKSKTNNKQPAIDQFTQCPVAITEKK